MAKYDQYIYKNQVVGKNYNGELTLTVLFEDGDNISAVIASTRAIVHTEIDAIKATNPKA